MGIQRKCSGPIVAGKRELLCRVHDCGSFLGVQKRMLQVVPQGWKSPSQGNQLVVSSLHYSIDGKLLLLARIEQCLICSKHH